MTNSLIKARGYFWWSDAAIPENCFAPSSMVTGEIEIGPTGYIELKLDAMLPRGLMADNVTAAFSGDPPTLPICGILIGSNQYVRLTNLFHNGATFSTGGPSVEAFVAHECLVASEPFSQDEPQFECLQLPLDGYEKWLGLQSIEVTA